MASQRTNLGLLGVAAIAALLAGPSSAQRGGPLNGTWRGTLAVVAATPATPPTFWQVGDRPEIEITIAGKSATVRVKAQTWQALKVADGFRVTQIDRTGLVSGQQVANGWAEHWNLTVTTKSSDELLVFLSYVAGGSLDRAEHTTAEFAVGAMGEIGRIDESATSGDRP